MDSDKDDEDKARKLVGWTCAWMQALPVAALRALQEDEKELLRQIFVQVLSDRRVELSELDVPRAMISIHSI